jgi:hypothetical protein
MLSSWYSKSPELRALLSSILAICKQNSIDVLAMWLSSSENLLADKLSRLVNEYVLRLSSGAFTHFSNILGFTQMLELNEGEEVS